MESTNYNLAVIFDDVRADFDAAQGELVRLSDKLGNGGPLKEIDLLFLQPSTLVGRLGFDPKFVRASKIADRLSVAQSRHFRVLDLMSMSGADGASVYRAQLAQAEWKRTPSEDVAADLDDLRTAIGARNDGPERRLKDRIELALPVHFEGGKEPAVGLARNISGEGMYIESDVIPDPATVVWLTLKPLAHTELSSFPAMVVHTLDHEHARMHGRVPGFGVNFEFNEVQRRLFDSFLVSAIRGKPWPERSGRRHSRFPLSLPVTWKQGGESVEGQTKDISRGGFFLVTDAAFEANQEVDMTMLAADNVTGESFLVRVARTITVEKAEKYGSSPGVGVEFMDATIEVGKKLEKVLGKAELPTIYRALIVDDDSFSAELIGGTLHRGGYQILRASSVEEAKQCMMKELFRVDVVLIDFHIAGEGYGGLTDWVRKADGCSDVAISVLSAAELSSDAVASVLQSGPDEVLHKELGAEELLRRVDAIIRMPA